MRFTIDVKFPSDDAKEAFLTRLGTVRDLMSPPGSAKLDNHGLLSALLSLAEDRQHQHARRAVPSASSESEAEYNPRSSVLPAGGK